MIPWIVLALTLSDVGGELKGRSDLSQFIKYQSYLHFTLHGLIVYRIEVKLKINFYKT